MPPFHLSFLLDNFLILSCKTCFFGFPFWLPLCAFFCVLGRSAKAPVQAYVQHCLWVALGNLFGAISDPQLVASSPRPRCMLNEQSWAHSWLLPAQGLQEGQLNSQSTQSSTFACRLSARLNHRKSWLYSSTGVKLHRVWWKGFMHVGLLLPPRLMLHSVECSGQERWLLQHEEWMSTVILAADPSARSTNPRLSIHGSNMLCPPSARGQHMWLQTKFCALAFEEGVWISSLLSLFERNCAAFHSQMLCDSRTLGLGAQIGV